MLNLEEKILKLMRIVCNHLSYQHKLRYLMADSIVYNDFCNGISLNSTALTNCPTALHNVSIDNWGDFLCLCSFILEDPPESDGVKSLLDCPCELSVDDCFGCFVGRSKTGGCVALTVAFDWSPIDTLAVVVRFCWFADPSTLSLKLKLRTDMRFKCSKINCYHFLRKQHHK